MNHPPNDWYKHWDLGIKNHSWVEKTAQQVDFIIAALSLTGYESVLDLACGFGRHSLELAGRGYRVVGVDITECYIEDARKTASGKKLDIEFICADIRNLTYCGAFDVVLNLADGAIGYLENDEENLKIFTVIARALKPGGRSLIDICSQEHAIMHFPKKHWEIGTNELSLPVFDYDETTRRMLYGGFSIPFGAIARPPQSTDAHSSTRLYSYEEVKDIFDVLNVETLKGYGEYDLSVPMSHKCLQQIIISVKR